MQSHTPHPTPHPTPTPTQGEGGASHPPRAAPTPCKGLSRGLYGFSGSETEIDFRGRTPMLEATLAAQREALDAGACPSVLRLSVEQRDALYEELKRQIRFVRDDGSEVGSDDGVCWNGLAIVTGDEEFAGA